MVQHLEQPWHAAAQPILDPGEVGQVRWWHRGPVRRRQNSSRHRAMERPVLDVDDHVDHERLAVHRGERPPVRGELKRDAGIGPHTHLTFTRRKGAGAGSDQPIANVEPHRSPSALHLLA